MKRCGTCQRVFDGDEAFCPFDASPLSDWETDDPYVGRLIAGRYRVLRELGGGGMGVVYAAEQAPMARPVALKFLKGDRASDSRSVERFRQEARAISALRSPHVVALYDFGQDEDGALYLAMELLEGQTLRQRLKSRGRMSLEEAAPIWDQIARGLSEAHTRGLLHRDIKPANIFLGRSADYDQFVKLLDFGVAASLEPKERGITDTGELPGTAGYLAPERILGEQVDARADVYALGVVMYETLTCRRPHEPSTNSSYEVLRSHLDDDPLPLDEVVPDISLPEPVVALLWRCLAKSPDMRPDDAAAFRTELLRALDVSGNANWSYDTGLAAPTLDTRDSAGLRGGPLDVEDTPPVPAATLGWRAALAAVLMLGLGFGAGWWGRGEPAPGVAKPLPVADKPVPHKRAAGPSPVLSPEPDAVAPAAAVAEPPPNEAEPPAAPTDVARETSVASTTRDVGPDVAQPQPVKAAARKAGPRRTSKRAGKAARSGRKPAAKKPSDDDRHKLIDGILKPK